MKLFICLIYLLRKGVALAKAGVELYQVVYAILEFIVHVAQFPKCWNSEACDAELGILLYTLTLDSQKLECHMKTNGILHFIFIDKCCLCLI